MNKSEEDIDGINLRLERLLNLISNLDESYASIVNFEAITDWLRIRDWLSVRGWSTIPRLIEFSRMIIPRLNVISDDYSANG